VSAIVAAREYARRGWRVFPCRDKNQPLVKWRREATTDEIRIREWWRRWPRAEIGLPTGEWFVVLDVDVKVSPTGLDTLDELGFPLWFETPTVDTPSGGLHGYFRPPVETIRNTVGKRGRGIGPQLDWRGVGGYIITPSLGSGYQWDTILGPDTPLAEVPPELLPREPERVTASRPVRPSNGLSAYAEAALRKACANIVRAPDGEQEATLHREVFSIATLAASGGIPEQFARQELLFSALQMRDYDHRRPWRATEINQKVARSFASGLTHPR
jgi:hypothetical protein